MNRKGLFIVIFIFLSFQQCKVMERIEVVGEKKEYGLQGYINQCQHLDTIKTVTISKADAIITFQGDRYEARLSLFHRLDSIIFLTAVSNGYEVFRGSVDHDSIRVIDRINRTVYISPMNKRFGYKHPVSFRNFETLTSLYGCCDLVGNAYDFLEGNILFDISEEFITRKIYLDRQTFGLNKFEFFNTRSNEYIVGEKQEGKGFRFFSNFLINDFEILASGGEIMYNQPMEVNMEVNRRRYSFIELQ